MSMRIFTSLTEGLRIAFRALSINKVRSVLTALCIIIGITMVTVVDAVTTGMDETFDRSMAMLGTNVVYIEKWPWDDDLEWWEIMNRPEIELSYRDFLQERSKLASEISAYAQRGTNIKYKGETAERVGIVGATANHLLVQGMNIVRGRMFTEQEVRNVSKVIVLGQSLVDGLFEENEDPLGKQVKIRGRKFTVIGVLEKQGMFLGLGDADNQVIIPVKTYGTLFGLKNDVRLGVKFPDEETFIDGEYEIEGLMRQVRQLDAAEDNDFAINKPQAFEEVLSQFKNGLYMGGFVLVGLSLLIGGIGIMNIMFVSVRERTKEIGIRKAVGAKSWEILSQFLIESVTICVAGGVIGVIIAGILTLIIDQFFTATMNVSVVAFAFILCSLVGVIFGFIPAYRAAKSDPIESLRFE